MLKAFIAVLLMALVTYLPRAIPISFFRREITSPFIRSFLYYVPYAVLGALTFPAIFTSTKDLRTALCGLLVILLLAYKKKGLVIVSLGGIVTVYIASLLFR